MSWIGLWVRLAAAIAHCKSISLLAFAERQKTKKASEKAFLQFISSLTKLVIQP
jgi:hypothetical protein